jgi:hypothetical protein
LFHSISGTFGFILEYHKFKLGYISDTGYTKKFRTTTDQVYETGNGTYEGDFSEILTKHIWIKEYFSQVDYLIANINDLLFTKHSKYHLTGFDLIDILKNSRVKQCIIQHRHPVDLLNLDSANLTAKYISQESKISTISVPVEGMKVNL